MRIGKWARLLLLGAPILAGCSGFWNAPSGGNGTGGCTTNCSTAGSGNFYILNNGTTPQLLGYSFVAGVLTPITGSPFAVAGAPFSMTIAPGGNFMYVSSAGAGVDLYPIGSGGALGTPTNISADQAFAMQVDLTNGWLIEALQATGGVQLNAIPIQSDGTYNTAIQVQTRDFALTATGLPLGQLVISPDNSNIFVALGTAGTLVVPFNPSVTTANPNPMGANGNVIAVAHTGGSAQSVAVDPTNRLFYVGETLGNSAGTSGGLRVFNYSTARSATVTSVANSPFASGGLSPNSILPLANGNYVYVANGAGNNAAGNIAAFTVSNTGTDTAPVYAVTAGPTIAAGTLPIGLAEDNTGVWLLAVNSSGAPYFDSYTFDATTPGTLDVQVVANTGAAPVAIAATH
jgi:hypothetical protein